MRALIQCLNFKGMSTKEITEDTDWESKHSEHEG